eukprot:SAG31_NODE_487_length_14980_cov_9.526376_17_plen_174_part_00
MGSFVHCGALSTTQLVNQLCWVAQYTAAWHLGEATFTDDSWRCAATTASNLAAAASCPSTPGEHAVDQSSSGGCSTPRNFVAVDQRMTWADARDYCRLHFDDLASIHSAEDFPICSRISSRRRVCAAADRPARPLVLLLVEQVRRINCWQRRSVKLSSVKLASGRLFKRVPAL